MMCYLDKTFCKSDCTNESCFRFFGPEQQEGARKWWDHDPDNAPIAFSDFSDACKDYTNAL